MADNPKCGTDSSPVEKIMVKQNANLRSERAILNNEMRQFILREFPELHSSCYLVPPAQFNKVRSLRVTERSSPGHDVFEQILTPDSDLRSNRTTLSVRRCLDHIIQHSDSAPMMVLFDYSFENYLCKLHAKGSKSLQEGHHQAPHRSIPLQQKCSSTVVPAPSNFKSHPRKGDFDVLIISRRFGFVVMEIKSLGDKMEAAGAPIFGQDIDSLRKAIVNKALPQLVKAKSVLQEKFEDLRKTIAVTQCFVFPNTPRRLLKCLLVKDPGLKEQLLQSLGEETFEELLKHFLCAEEANFVDNRQLMSSISDVLESFSAMGDLSTDITFQTKTIASTEPTSQIGSDSNGAERDKETISQISPVLPEERSSRSRPDKRRGEGEGVSIESQDCWEQLAFHPLKVESQKNATHEQEAVIMKGLPDTPIRTSDLLLEWWNTLINQICCKGNKINSPRNELQLEGQRLEESVGFSSEEYEEIISRFCGPYSKVSIEQKKHTKDEVRTISDCIHLTGIRFGRSILRPEQLKILNSDEKFVYILGPPGSGKTLILGLKAAEWAKAGHSVVFLSCEGVDRGSLVTWTLRDQVIQALKFGRVKPVIATELDTHDRSRKPNRKEPLALTKSSEACRVGERRGGATCTTSTNNIQAKSLNSDEPSTNNVHHEIISLTTDPRRLIDKLVTNFEGKGLRIIIDEAPVQTYIDRLHELLCDARKQLKGVHALFQSMIHEDPTCFDANMCIQEDNDAIGKVFQEFDNRFEVITHRVGNLHPDSIRLDIAQSDIWRIYISGLEKWCKIVKEDRQFVWKLCLMAPKDWIARLINTFSEIDQKMTSTMGSLFSVQTPLKFFPFKDIFNLVAKDYSTKDICLWSSGIFSSYQPDRFQVKALSCCVRCPPEVQKVLELTEKCFRKEPYTYTTENFPLNPPLPTSGLPVKLINHSLHDGMVAEIINCENCATALADYLLDTLRIGKPDSKLQAHDVIISGSPIHTPTCEFITALIGRGLDVQFESQTLTSPPPYLGKVLVIGGSTLHGLETQIVVYVPEVKLIPKRENIHASAQCSGQSELQECISKFDGWNKRYLWGVASRAVSHLILFHV